MAQLLHYGDLVLQRFFEVTVRADQLLLDSLDGDLAALVAGSLVDLPKRTLPQAVPLVYRVIFNLLYHVHVNNNHSSKRRACEGADLLKKSSHCQLHNLVNEHVGDIAEGFVEEGVH